jgi:hypothetical protein
LFMVRFPALTLHSRRSAFGQGFDFLQLCHRHVTGEGR